MIGDGRDPGCICLGGLANPSRLANRLGLSCNEDMVFVRLQGPLHVAVPILKA